MYCTTSTYVVQYKQLRYRANTNAKRRHRDRQTSIPCCLVQFENLVLTVLLRSPCLRELLCPRLKSARLTCSSSTQDLEIPYLVELESKSNCRPNMPSASCKGTKSASDGKAYTMPSPSTHKHAAIALPFRGREI